VLDAVEVDADRDVGGPVPDLVAVADLHHPSYGGASR
jgi:hypothetical protein